MTSEIIRLFKGFIGEKSNSVNEKALAYGLLIPSTASEEVVNEAIKQYGKDGILWNQTFHKDFKTVAETPEAILIIQQLVHYITTYGFEALGIYDESTVYIPAEKLEVPSLDVENIKLIAINALTEDEVKDKMMVLLTSGIALSKQTIDDVMELSDMIDKDRFDEVSNREVRIALYHKYNVMPKDPEAFLRYLIYELTYQTLKIQNRDLINYLSMRSQMDSELVYNLLIAYGNFEKLSSIFLRNKNLFLALKHEVKNNKYQAKVNSIINKLRKLAKTNHKPLKKAVLDSLTSDATISDEVLTAALNKVTTFREVRLLNTLNYRINGKKDIVYRVRNGKSFVSEINKDNDDLIEAMTHYYSLIRAHLVARLSKNINGKTLYIPEGFIYKAPTSEKQFVNNVPEGSYFELPVGKALVFATHWTNLSEEDHEMGRTSWYSNYDSCRVDLDMRMMNLTTNIGWNSSYKTNDNAIVFSGDMTNAPAPKGATEAIYVGKDVRNQSFIITLNDFTCHSVEVPYEFIVAEAGSKQFGDNYTVDPNKILNKFNLKLTPDQHQITLGQVRATETTKRFYFNNFAVGVSGAVSSQDKFTMGALSYMETYSELQTSLTELLIEAGAIVSKTQEVEVLVEKTIDNETVLVKAKRPVDIDLSIENITKESIIKLFC